MTPIKEAKEIAEVQQIVPQVKRLYSSLEDFKVTSKETYLEAGDKIKIVKERIKAIESTKSTILDPINEARANTIAFFETPLSLLREIKEKLDKKMSAYRNEQLEKERIAREKAEAEAREKERAEKERLRKEAEAKAEEARKAEEEAQAAKRKAEELAKKENYEKAEKARLEAEKKEKEASVLKEKAREKRQEAKEVEVEAKDVKPKVEKIDGLHFRRYWKARIVDATKVPRQFLKPDEVAINEYVSKNKENAAIPGVEVYYEDKSIG